MQAAKHGDEPVVEWLMEQPGVELNKTDREGRTRFQQQEGGGGEEAAGPAGPQLDSARELLELPDMYTVA